MRDLMKSMFSLGWALPMLALKQLNEVVKSGGQMKSLANDLDSITDAIEERLEGTTKGIYEGGDRLQRKVIDSLMPARRKEPVA